MRMQEKGIRRARKRILLVVFTAVALLLSIVPLIEAQEKSQEEAQELLDTSNRSRLELSVFFGEGTEDIDVGETTTGETVSISGGGGLGGTITFGYGISSKLDIDLTAGIQESELSPRVENADGSFDRNLFLATLKYKIPFSNNRQVKIGGGIGYYSSGELDVDTSQVGGFHEVINYDDAVGFHITGQYEHLFSLNWSWSIGAKYYNVTYDANSYTINGVSIPVTFLIDEVRSLDGSGFDLILCIARYF